MLASITWHDHHLTHAHKHVIWAVVALKSSFTLRLHQHGIANAKVVELFPYSRPSPPPSFDLHVTESVLRLTLRSLLRKNALDRMLTEIEMMFKWRWLGWNIFPYWKKKKKKKLLFFNEIWRKSSFIAVLFLFAHRGHKKNIFEKQYCRC